MLAGCMQKKLDLVVFCEHILFYMSGTGFMERPTKSLHYHSSQDKKTKTQGLKNRQDDGG